MFKNKKLILALTLVVTFTLLAGVGCAPEGEEKEELEESHLEMEEVHFGYVQWPGVTVKTHVSRTILEELGYETSMEAYTQQVLFEGMAQGDVDAFLGNWDPTMRVNFKPYQDDGDVVNVARNLDQALYRTAVPEYVWEAGVKSMADLHEHKEKFDGEIIGLEPGNDGNQIILDAIENDTYNLSDWELQTGNTAAMLAALDGATRDEEWIAFNGWEPHWMNVAYDIKYLEDPEGIWGEDDTVYTVAPPELEEEASNFWKFLEQFEVTSDIQSEYILEYQEKERDPSEVAEEWVANNLDIVSKWVEGMVAKDGREATEVLKEAFAN